MIGRARDIDLLDAIDAFKREHFVGAAWRAVREERDPSVGDRSQGIADGAYFLGFDGLIAPGARWACLNLVLFTERLAPQRVSAGAAAEIVWDAWRKRTRR